MILKEGSQLDQETDKMVYGQAQSLNDFTSQENQIFENTKITCFFLCTVYKNSQIYHIHSERDMY